MNLRTNERTKRCTRCQIVKPWSDYYQAHNGRSRLAGPRSECKDCGRDARRENARNQRQDPEYRASRNAYKRDLRARLRQDPEYRATERDYKREWLRRKRNTAHPRPPLTLAVRTRLTIPAEPFRAWLESLAPSVPEIARRTELPERRVRSVLGREQERVELDTVDRALLAVGDGTTLDDLYAREELAA